MPKRKKKLSELFPERPNAGATKLNKAEYPEERKVGEAIQGLKGIEYGMPQRQPYKSKSLNKNRLKIKGNDYLI